MKNKTNPFIVKKILLPVFAIFTLVLLFSRCANDSSGTSTETNFSKLKGKALSSITQNFHFNAGSGYVSFTTIKGVNISFNSDDLTLNGNPVTGQVNLKFIEIFDGATMLTTGMHTMGLMPDGKKAVMNSAGEFYINATKNGQQLELSSDIQLIITSDLTDDVGGNPDMTLWNFAEEDSVWVQQEPNPIGIAGVFLGNEQIVNGSNARNYYAFINNFGWTNVDCFYEDPRPRTTILAAVPNGYNYQNSAVYLHYDGQGNALANLDTYDTATGLFSEHYGQIPIGLVCHVIFTTEDNGKWRYAIKATTIAAGDIYNFTTAETTVGTQAQMIAAIDALP